MNSAKNSLLDNKDEILSNLPKEFHEDFLKNIEEMPDAQEATLSDHEVVAAIKAELVANPDVDESAAAAELKDIKAPVAAAPPSEAEMEEQKAQLMAEAKAQTPE
jgi:hypothetical protein